ncbi:hypothetical protein JCM11251_007281 [Rhodosporidiobolus azoricus]
MRQYIFEENEALNGRQMVTVKDAMSGKTIWTKTRDLNDDEIVSTIFDSLHNPRWRIHRPTKGWYLILQRRGDETYIELKPASRSSSSNSSSASSSSLELVFTIRTPPPHAQRSKPPSLDGRKSPNVRLDMSPPPFEAASSAMSPSFSSVSAASSSTAVSATSTTSLALDLGKTPTRGTFSSSVAGPGGSGEGLQPTRFRLQPFIPASHTKGGGEGGLITRLKGLVADPKKRWSVVWEEGSGQEGTRSPASLAGDQVVLTFEEQSSGFFNPHLNGLLSLSTQVIDASGLEPSFWIALCCAYADVLEEKEGWEAAKEGD